MAEPPQLGRHRVALALAENLHVVGANEQGGVGVGGPGIGRFRRPRQGAARKHIHRPHEAHHKGRGRVVVDLGRGADLLDAALVHHHDPVGHLHGLLLVVGHDHGGHVHLVVEVAQPSPQLLAHLGIEGAEGLIEQQHPGLHRQGPGQGHPLALAAGELGGETRSVALQLHQIEQLIDAALDRLLLPAAQLQAKGHVLAHGAVLEQGEVLKHEAHLPVLHGAIGGLLSGDPDAAGVGLLQAGDQTQQRALARARWAQ